MPAKVSTLLCYKCAWYFMETSKFNHPNLLVDNVYQFHLHFHLRTVLHHLGITLPHEDIFSKVKNSHKIS